MEKITTATPDIEQENIDQLVELFPQVATEVQDENGEVKRAVDFDALRDLLGNVAEGQRERYQFTWPGKREAKAEARRGIDKTMIPCKEESVNWDTTENLYIKGDNLDALKILRSTYAGLVDLIYIDPPYNTGHDFVYDDDFTQTHGEYDLDSGEFDEEGGQLVVNLESNGRFHSDWCSMIYPRISLARDLLTPDGLFFISINDVEVTNLKKICDEIFGSMGFIADLVWANQEGGGSSDSKLFRIKHEHILCYSRNRDNTEIQGVPISNADRYTGSDEYEPIRGKYYLQKLGMGSIQYSASLDYPITVPDGTTVMPSDNNSGRKACWRWSKEKFVRNQGKGFVEFKKDRNGVWTVYTKQYMNCDNEGNPIVRTQRPMGIINEYSTTQAAKQLEAMGLGGLFSYSKPVPLLNYLISRCTNESALVFDFFSGSASMAHAVMAKNAEDGGKRKFILVQIPEEASGEYATLCDIGKERIRRAGARIVAEVEESNKQLKIGAEAKPVPDIGFRVLKIDSSNFKDTYANPQETTQASLLGLIDNVKEGRTEEDLLFQILSKFRIPYSAHIETKEICGKQVFDVEDGQLVACFDTDVTNDVITEIAKMRPNYAVMRDLSFRSDASQANFEEIFKTFSPDTIRRVI